MSRLTFSATAAFALVLLAAAPALAKPGRCLIEVDGTRYLDGRCNVQLEPNGSFTVGTASGSDKSSRHFAYVLAESTGRANAYWSGSSPGSPYAHDALGTVTRKGACWINVNARICAWAY